jgi:hypothetical protein
VVDDAVLERERAHAPIENGFSPSTSTRGGG